MAIDTRNRRASCLGIDGAYRVVFPNPDGTIDQPDRQQSAYKYPGITAAGAAAGQPMQLRGTLIPYMRQWQPQRFGRL